MAIYHLEAKVVGRGAGRSAVAASAYLSCSRLYNDYDGIQHDYTKKQGLVWQEVFLPEYAPQEWQDREKLWNAVEEVETAKDSRLAREFVVALPIELNREEQIELLQEFIREQFVADGMCADAAIHDTDGRNPHAHILLTVRPLDEQGHWQYKTEKEYLCMRNGEERGFTAAEFKAAQNERWEKQYPYKVGKKKVYMVPSEADAQGLARADKHPKSTRYGRQNPILDRWREYLGHTVNFKTTKKSYKSKKKIQNPESEWVIFENTHEPIWTESIADAVRLARQTRRRPTKMGEMGMFSGMMFCADCGSIMYQCRATGFRREQEYYLCAGYRKSRDICGSTHSILTVILEELILQNLCKVVSYAREQEDQFVKMVMDMDEKERSKGLAKKKKLLTDAEKRISELDRIFKHLYEDNITGKLTDERFKKLSADYEAEQAALQTQANSLREEIQEEESKCANVERFLSIVRKYTEIPELTPHILHEFVEKIVVHAATDPHSKTNRKQEVDIYYKGIGILEMSKVFDIRQNEETA